MTVPGGGAPDGILTARLVVDASQTGNEFSRALERTNVSSRRDQERVGREITRNISNGIRRDANAFEGVGRNITGRLAAGIIGNRRVIRRVGRSLLRDMADGFAAEGSFFAQVLSGLFTGVQRTVGPILGSIFNVSGRSPALFLILLPLIGSLVALVLGLLQGLHAVAALLATIPNLLFAIGLQASALFFIFNGFFQAVGNLAAAKNIGELNNLLKGTNKEMAGIIKQLFPFKKLFSDIGQSAKTAFFGGLGDIFTQLYAAFTRTNSLMYSMTIIASGLANVVKSLLGYFATDEFNNFMIGLANSTKAWLDGFGPALAQFVGGLTRFGVATLPYVEWFGTQFNNWIASIGRWFDRMADPNSGFLDWLERAKVTLDIFLEVLGRIWRFIKIFLKNLDAAGGDLFLERIGEIFERLNRIFDSDFGRRAIHALLQITLICLGAAAAILIMIGAILYLLDVLWEVIKAIGEGFALIFQYLKKAWDAAYTWILGLLLKLAFGIAGFITGAKDQMLNWLGGIPAAIIGFFADIGTWLYDKGVQLIQGLINGAISKLGFLAPAIKAALRSFGLGFLVGGGEGGGITLSKSQAAGVAASSVGVIGGPAGVVGGVVGGVLGQGLGPNTTSNSNANTTNVAMGQGAFQVVFQSTEPPTTEQARAVSQTASSEYLAMLNKLSARTM